MNDALLWIMESGERVTIVGLLMITIFVIVYGLHKRWWAPGYFLTTCETRVTKLEAEIAENNIRTRERLEELEALVNQPVRTRRRTPPRKEASS